MKITVIITINAPVATVWRAYTTPADIMQWNAAPDDWHTPSATVDLREGGRFCSRMEARDGSMGFDFEGVYTLVDTMRRIEYGFSDRTAQVLFDETDDGVRVEVTVDAEDTHPPEMQRSGWQSILDNFKRHVEAISA